MRGMETAGHSGAERVVEKGACLGVAGLVAAGTVAESRGDMQASAVVLKVAGQRATQYLLPPTSALMFQKCAIDELPVMFRWATSP